MLLIVLWVRSYWNIDSITVRIPNIGSTSVSSLQGRYLCSKVSEAAMATMTGKAYAYGTQTVQTWSIHSQPIDRLLAERIPKLFQLPSFPGFKIRLDANVPSGNVRLVLPHWFTVGLSTTFSVVPWFALRKSFSLRTLLIATTLIAVVLGLAVWLTKAPTAPPLDVGDFPADF